MITQDQLARELEANLLGRGGDALSAALRERPLAEALEQIQEGESQTSGRSAVLVIVGHFELEDYLRGLITFLRQLDADVLASWHASFTRAVYLAGSPPRFLPRIDRPATIAPSGNIAWVGPGGHRENKPVVQLLQPLRTARCPDMPDVTIPLNESSPTRPLELLVDMSRMASLEAYLISVGHCVAESFHLGHLQRATSFRIRHVEPLEVLDEDRLFTRVHLDPLERSRLALLACLKPA